MELVGSERKSVSLLVLGWFISLFSYCSNYQHKIFLTLEEYYRQPRDKPYILFLETKDSSLLYYGAFHTVDPKDPQISDIEKRWEAFKPTIALSEGCIWPLEKSREEAICKYGEQGLLRYLANRDRIPIKSIDLPISREVRYLRRLFYPGHVNIYYVMRQAVINQRLKKDENDVDYVNRILLNLSKIDSYKCDPSCLDEFEIAVGYIFPHLKEWQSIPCSYFLSDKQGKVLARIHRKVNEFRNRKMVNILLKELRKGKRIFAVVGRSHVVIQEPVLRLELGIID